MAADGRLTVNTSADWEWSDIFQVTGDGWKTGGEWQPADCVARYHMAIIIPFRDRDFHLKALLHHIIPILRRQLIHFRIFVVEQVIIGASCLPLSSTVYNRICMLHYVTCKFRLCTFTFSKCYFSMYLFIYFLK